MQAAAAAVYSVTAGLGSHAPWTTKIKWFQVRTCTSTKVGWWYLVFGVADACGASTQGRASVRYCPLTALKVVLAIGTDPALQTAKAPQYCFGRGQQLLLLQPLSGHDDKTFYFLCAALNRDRPQC